MSLDARRLLMAGLKQTFYGTPIFVDNRTQEVFYITSFDTWDTTQIMTFYPGFGYIPTDYEVNRHQTDVITSRASYGPYYSSVQTWKYTTW